jgi:hypothetical protein
MVKIKAVVSKVIEKKGVVKSKDPKKSIEVVVEIPDTRIISIKPHKHINATDKNINDWGINTAPAIHLSTIINNISETERELGNEWIWRTLSNNARKDVDVDLVEFRVTGDKKNIYFLAKFEEIKDPHDPYLAIGIHRKDFDQKVSKTFPDHALVDAIKGLGRIICVQQDGGKVLVGFYDEERRWHYTGKASINSKDDSIEVSMPWKDLGIKLPCIVRFFVIIGKNQTDTNRNMKVFDNWGPIDVVSIYSPKREIEDGKIDYNFPIPFNRKGIPVMTEDIKIKAWKASKF